MAYVVQNRLTTETEEWRDVIDYNLSLKKGKLFTRYFFDEESAKRFVNKEGNGNWDLHRIVEVEDTRDVPNKID